MRACAPMPACAVPEFEPNVSADVATGDGDGDVKPSAENGTAKTGPSLDAARTHARTLARTHAHALTDVRKLLLFTNYRVCDNAPTCRANELRRE